MGGFIIENTWNVTVLPSGYNNTSNVCLQRVAFGFFVFTPSNWMAACTICLVRLGILTTSSSSEEIIIIERVFEVNISDVVTHAMFSNSRCGWFISPNFLYNNTSTTSKIWALLHVVYVRKFRYSPLPEIARTKLWCGKITMMWELRLCVVST